MSKSFLGKLFRRLLLVVVLLSILPAQALAFSVDIRNPYRDTMHVALVDFADDAGTWRSHGWWTVKPLTTRRLIISSSTARNHIYLYVKTSEATWSGEGIPSSVVRTVISNSFSYYDKQSCPPGPNRRKVFFTRYKLTNGFLYWSPE